MAGFLTRDQMANEVVDYLGKSSTLTLRSSTTLSTRIVTWLDRAQIRIARRHLLLYKESTATTITSQKTYSFPSNLRAVVSLRLEDGANSVKLRPVMPWTFDRLEPKPDTETEGRPDFYIPFSTFNKFELFRIPDQGYTLRLRWSYWPTRLTSADQTSDFTHLDDVIVFWATAFGYMWLQELQDAAFWRKRGEEALADAINAERNMFPDWMPFEKGFSSTAPDTIGEYYNDPFVRGIERIKA